MNRKISLSIEDIYIKYAGEAFGATGSHNALTLRMIFGSAWDGTAKTAYFTDALGSASVSIVLGLDKLVGGAYEIDVPSEALKYAGEATVTIKGVLTSGDTTTKAITTAAGHFRVLDSELPESAGNVGTITPSDKEQLQAEIAGLENLFTTTKTAAETAAANAKVSEDKAKASEESAESSATAAEASKTAAAGSAATAAEKATAASDSASKAAASQTAAKSSEDKVKASETAAESAKTAAEAAKAEAAESAESASASAQTAQSAASSAGAAASTASSAASAASGSASNAAGSAAAAAESAASVAGINKTAESWAVGGTGTREGENTNNAKYWAQQAEATVGGDFATKAEAQGYVTTHNQSVDAHADIREALAGKETAGAAATVQSNLTAHAGNTTVHVTAEQKTTWNGKAAGKHASQHGANGSDPITPSAIGAIATTAKGTAGGVASLDTTGKVPSSQLPEISSAKTYTATIGTTWTEDSDTGVKTQNVAIPGVLASHTAKVDHAYTGSGTSLSYAAFVEAENQYLSYITNGFAETYDGGIKFTIFGDTNTVSIPIVVEVA
nr:MAG TPA: L SHAPED TAIL FIBER PROTEIN [Caudoviricetes sp.]